ncbi:MAG: tetratricopeptide repeat protein [Roseiarcus sp.]|jgi:predicted O-linked N-acetylglucosamine transferase (SPINDLY family)
MTLDVPATPVPCLDRAFDLHEAGDLDGAIALCEAILRLDDRHYGALYLLGSILGEKRKLDEAAAALERAIAIDPSRPLAYFNLANVLRWMGRFAESLAAIDACLSLKAENAEALALRADVLTELGRLDDALLSADRAIAAAPAYAEAHNVRGNALAKLRRLAEAKASYDRAVALDPRYAQAFYNRGIVLEQQGFEDQALEDWRKAIALKPDYAEAYCSLGNLLEAQGLAEKALTSFELASRANPSLDYLQGAICHIRRSLCDWSDSAASQRLREAIAAGQRATSPFDALAVSDSDALNRKAAEIYLASEFAEIPNPPAFARAARRDRIRLGYFSSDLRNHATSHLLAGVIERHDKTRFEVSAFSFGPGYADDMRKRLTAAFDHFLDVSERSDTEIAELARSLGIDIALDLNGYTRHHRIGIFANRAAPIQAGYLGYPGTTGAPFVDYLIADRVIVPHDQSVHFPERIVRLPNTYFPYDRTLEIADETPSRASLPLPERGFVYCSFNQSYKISPEVFDSWMRILQRTPGSVLWLLRDNESAAENLRREARARAIDPDRLVFADRLPIARHLARHRQADLFLDTLPVNAHTTACDALWAGLPVLTRIGEAFAGRVAASLLTAIGAPELIARSQSEYEAMAVELAANTDRLAAIRAKLANNRLTTALFDTELYTRDLERAFEAMWERHRLGLPPVEINLAPTEQAVGLARP